MSAAIKKRYEVELYFKNVLEDRVVLVPMTSEHRTLSKALAEVERAEKRPEDFAKAVITEYDLIKGIRIQSSRPMVHIIDEEFLRNYSK
jgi:hypothetical protein